MKLLRLSLRSWHRTLPRWGSQIFLSGLAMAMLCGSLMVGFSVEENLRRIGYDRLGRARYIMPRQEGISEKLALAFNTLPGHGAVLTAAKAVSASYGGISLPNASVYGADQNFFDLYETSLTFPGPGEIIVNRHLAERLGVVPGDSMILNLRNSPAVPVEIPLSRGVFEAVPIALKVKEIIPDKGAGNFSMRIGSQVEDIIFMNNGRLREELGLESSGNLVLLEVLPEGDLDFWLRGNWSMADLSLYWEDLGGFRELRSQKFFISPSILSLIESVPGSEKISSGFMASVAGNVHETPYSFFASDYSVSSGMIISRWLADDSGLQPGDAAVLKWWAAGEDSRLIQREMNLEVAAVIDNEEMNRYGDRIPPVPGISSTADCRSWDSGIPINFDLIRTKDEQWWDLYGLSPRILLSGETASQINQSRFGSYTGIRYNRTDTASIEKIVLSSAVPSQEGFIFTDFYEVIERGSVESVDFGSLFLGLNFFLVISCLYLLYQAQALAMQMRKNEIFLLNALGYDRGGIIKWFFPQILGSLTIALFPGFVIAAAYQLVTIETLNLQWSGAVAGTRLGFVMNYPLMAAGLFAGWLLSLGCALAAFHRVLREAQGKGMHRKAVRLPLPVLIAFLGGLSVFLGHRLYYDKQHQPEAFFSLGFALLLLLYFVFELLFFERKGRTAFGPSRLILEEVRRNRRAFRIRYFLYSASLFLLLTLTLPFGDTVSDSGGTGGYSHYTEIAMPWIEEREGVVGLRMREGDDASCLNLNRVFNPAILGVPAQTFALESTFLFDGEKNASAVWRKLDEPRSDGRIPAVADATIMTWNLKADVGDTMLITDEKGRQRELIFIAALSSSIFQGNVLISESHFKELYPLTAGYRVLLLEDEHVLEDTEWLLKSQGAVVTGTSERLKRFGEVQDNYLRIFSALGLAALIIGSFGAGLHFASEVKAEGEEWALLSVLGFTDCQRFTRLLFRYSFVLISAFLASAFSVVLPLVIWAAGTNLELNWMWFLVVYSGMLFFHLMSSWIIFCFLKRTSLMAGVRNL